MHNEPSSVTAPQMLVKQPGETRQFSMDFSSLLATSETISSPSVSSSPSGLTLGVASVSGSKVLFDISSGTHPVKYRLEVTVTTSGGAGLARRYGYNAKGCY